MDDLSALGLMMGHESDWNDSEDDVDYQDENGFDEQYEPLDIAQLDDHIEEISDFQQEESIDDGPALPHLPSSATPLDFFMLMVGADFLSAWQLRRTDMLSRIHLLLPTNGRIQLPLK